MSNPDLAPTMVFGALVVYLLVQAALPPLLLLAFAQPGEEEEAQVPLDDPRRTEDWCYWHNEVEPHERPEEE